ncbi:MAG: type II toxin-antitoxin system Phd/YefM family antitoxin [Rhizobiales bacterium]|nr:type II toxin-antitoxin system Phd/YefM family antitoxin [Hyphomicrobiales bacterium]
MRRIPAREAKNQLGEHIDAAQREAVVITKHGRPTAALVSIDELAQIPRYHDIVSGNRSARHAETDTQRTKRVMQWYGALKGTFGTSSEIDDRIARDRAAWDR